MKRLLLLFAAALVIVPALGFAALKLKAEGKAVEPTQSSVTSTVQPPKLTKYQVGPPTESELLELVNNERKKHGVKPLKIDQRLNASAQFKADDMAKYDYFDHVKPGEVHMNGVQEAYDNTRTASGTSYCKSASENIQYTELGTSQTAFDWWMGSKPHRKAILNPGYTLTGLGITYDNKFQGWHDVQISVQHFCET